MKIKSIKNAKNLSGKIVLLRADLNVPMKNGLIKSDYKIVATLPTVRYLLRHNSKIIITTHLNKGNSAEPAAKRLARLLGRKILFINKFSVGKIKKAVEKMENKDMIFLENLRFNSGEEKNDKKFAKSLAGLADIYVNDAFAVGHRKHASLSAIKKYLPAFAGLLLEKEILNLNKILKPKQPLISIIGGAKIKTKIALIKKLAKMSLRILIGGALANNFIAAHGFKIGKSLVDKTGIKIAAELAKKHKNIILPVDVMVAKKANGKNIEVKPVNKVAKDDIILDIGPRTIKLFVSFIRQANTIVWNGPMGYFENERFKHGTLSIARFVATRSTGRAFGAVGGRETIEALKMTKMENYIDWVSTGGGAMLTYLGGEPMPGLKGIVK
ncbi:phosphoglycerate kinase [Candidatus Falkowbacteria bacterium]|nr:phosphoglycerate kinase [Candidatus Falkowbacteria bacterium]